MRLGRRTDDLFTPHPIHKPRARFELATYCLQNSCSTAELSRHIWCGADAKQLLFRGFPGFALLNIGKPASRLANKAVYSLCAAWPTKLRRQIYLKLNKRTLLIYQIL